MPRISRFILCEFSSTKQWIFKSNVNLDQILFWNASYSQDKLRRLLLSSEQSFDARGETVPPRWRRLWGATLAFDVWVLGQRKNASVAWVLRMRAAGSQISRVPNYKTLYKQLTAHTREGCQILRVPTRTIGVLGRSQVSPRVTNPHLREPWECEGRSQVSPKEHRSVCKNEHLRSLAFWGASVGRPYRQKTGIARRLCALPARNGYERRKPRRRAVFQSSFPVRAGPVFSDDRKRR